jgi:hypothetical protein
MVVYVHLYGRHRRNNINDLTSTFTLIETWTRWYLHCGSLNFEIKNDGKYLEQSFHCPWSQPDSVKFKDVILSNYDLMKRELKLDSIYQSFWSHLPKGKTYSRSGYGMTYLMTDGQEAAWKKDQPRRDYLKSLKDTIDNYLNFKLDSLQATYDSTKYYCYDSYHLTFSKNGKLKDIWTHPSGKMKISDGLCFEMPNASYTNRWGTCKKTKRQRTH